MKLLQAIEAIELADGRKPIGQYMIELTYILAAAKAVACTKCGGCGELATSFCDRRPCDRCRFWRAQAMSAG